MPIKKSFRHNAYLFGKMFGVIHNSIQCGPQSPWLCVCACAVVDRDTPLNDNIIVSTDILLHTLHLDQISYYLWYYGYFPVSIPLLHGIW